jgi:hypothetical protein
VRDAVRAARAALPKWAGMTAYNRGQVLYRLAEMIEARTASSRSCRGPDEVERSVDRIVWYAGWADKLAQVLGSSNPVAGRTSTSPCPSRPASSRDRTGRAAAARARLARAAGAHGRKRVVAVASETHPLAAIELAEALATSDVPGGASTCSRPRAELAPWLAATWT